MIYTLTLNPALDRELLVSQIEVNTVLRSECSRVDVGGKGFNVSRALQGLGMQSVAVGFEGGAAGRELRGALARQGIQSRLVRVRGESRTNTSIVATAHSLYVKVNEPGPLISRAELARLIHLVGQLTGPGDWWVLSGSLPPGVPASLYAVLVERIRQQGGYSLLDSSGQALLEGLNAGPDLAKPNLEEALGITGRAEGHATPIELLNAVQGLSNHAVALSLGGGGALLSTDGQVIYAAAPPIQVANPIGAGDAFVAGWVYARVNGWPADYGLHWAVACGSAAAELPGTAFGSRERVEALFREIFPPSTSLNR